MALVKVGVIGVGHLGALHAKMLAQADGAALIGVYDVDKQRSAAIAAEVGARSFASMQELLTECDAVSIATPTKNHFETASLAMESGKHIFLEKPITATVEEARMLNAQAKKHSVKIQVGHIERFNPAILAVDRYRLNPLFIESHRLAQFNPRGSDVAVVLDLMIHDIDIILSLVNSEVVHVDANGVAVITDSADIANARLKFANGCVANVTASRISRSRMRKMRLFQENAYISIDFASQEAEVFHLADPNDASVTPTMLLGMIDKGSVERSIVYEKPEIPKINPLQHELQMFIDAIRKDARPVVSGEDGQRALEVAEEILRQIGA